jgi:FtsZ-binding cell division protein ZapB
LKIKYIAIVVAVAILIGVAITMFVFLRMQVSELQAKNDELSKEISELRIRNTELNSKIDVLQKENTELKSRIKELENEKEKLLSEKRKLEDRIIELNKTITTLQNKTKELQEEKPAGGIITLEPSYLIMGESYVYGFHPEFYNEFERKIGVTGLLGGYRLVKEVEKYYKEIRERNSILVVPPAGIEEYQELAEKFPDIAPISPEEAEVLSQLYGTPILYFKRDPVTNKIRGIIIAQSIDASLADLLAEKGVVLGRPFRYLKGELLILKG